MINFKCRFFPKRSNFIFVFCTLKCIFISWKKHNQYLTCIERLKFFQDSLDRVKFFLKLFNFCFGAKFWICFSFRNLLLDLGSICNWFLNCFNSVSDLNFANGGNDCARSFLFSKFFFQHSYFWFSNWWIVDSRSLSSHLNVKLTEIFLRQKIFCWFQL